MLLLVLILVVIAFGLLVVALLSGSVLWAWVSVAISVAAAGVLLLDWLQRRSAVRAGSGEAAVGGVRPAPSAYADLDPVTEVIPVLPRSAESPYGAAAAGPPAAARSMGTDGPAAGSDSEQTAVMPVLQPPGSAARPPGAPAEATRSSGSWSPSVTDGRGAAGSAGHEAPGRDTVAATAAGAAGDGGAGWPAAEAVPRPDPEVTLVVDTRAGSPDAGGATVVVPTGLATESGQDAGGETVVVATGLLKGAGPDAGGETVVVATGPLTGAGSDSAGESPVAAIGAPTGGGSEPAGQTVVVPADGPGWPDAEQNRAPGAEPGAAGGATGFAGDHDPAADAGPVAEHDPAAVGCGDAQQSGGTGAADPERSATGSEPPPAGTPDPAQVAQPGAEPPEEPRDPAAGALVAGLEDEVLVIDEQPRYHVFGCPSLVAQPLIPLPAREAVELGFTPCGWCTPDRTLAARHATPTG